jgi:uncharacterized membrane protein YdjX (TVP38/TMEM64 family)
MDPIRPARSGRPSWFAYLAFPLFVGLVLALLFAFREELLSVFRDREAIRSWVEARGAWGELAFVGLQVLQVVVFVIPGEVVQVAGGYVYGFRDGTLLSLAGITLGSLVNFLAGRWLGRPFVEAVFKKERVASIEKIAASGRAAAGFFILFVIPGIPKDALCYVAGMSRLGFPAFLAISMLGRLPGILGSSFMGSAAYSGSYRAALLVLAIASVLFFVGLFFKERIQDFLARLLKGR